MKIFKLTFIAVFLIAMAIGYAFTAGEANAEPMTVEAAVSGACYDFTVPTNVSVSYVAGQAGDEEYDAESITVDCTEGVSYTIGITGSSGQMTEVEGSATLDYGVYQDDCTTIWDDSASMVSGTSTGGPGSHTVCIKITAGQDVPTGSYEESLTATLNVN